MYVVLGTNRRLEAPPLDVGALFSSSSSSSSSPLAIPGGGAWRHSSARCPVRVLLSDLAGGERSSAMLTVRGFVHDDPRALTGVSVGGRRIPVAGSSRVGVARGGRVVADVRFMVSTAELDPVVGSPGAFAFSLSVPGGFSPVTLFSPLAETDYLCATVGEPTAMATEISPVSFTLLWPIGPTDGAPVVTVNSGRVDLPPEAEGSAGSTPGRLRVRASPESRYVCVVDNGARRYEVVLTTPRATREAYGVHYRSCRSSAGPGAGPGVYDLSHTPPGVVGDLRALGVIAPGDRVVLPGSDGVLTAVGSGDTISSSGSFYVIPAGVAEEEEEEEEEEEQYLRVESRGASHLVSFDGTESFVGYDSKRFFHGDSLLVGSRVVEVVRGSLILIVHDDAPREFPGGVDTAAQVEASGDVVLRDLVLKSSSQVTPKVPGDTTYGNSSYFVYDAANGTTVEATRVTHGMDDAGETGSVSLNVLYTQPAGAKVMHRALRVDPSEASFSAIDATGSLEATFDASGLRFNSDSGDVYFGAAQEFRIHFEPASGSDPSMLQIQGFSSETGGYVTRQLITNEPVVAG